MKKRKQDKTRRERIRHTRGDTEDGKNRSEGKHDRSDEKKHRDNKHVDG